MASNLNAGVGQHATVTNKTGKAGSVSQNPAPPVEAGNNSAKSAYTTVSSTAPLVPMPTFGSIATASLTTSVSTKPDGTQTAVATTVVGSGTGATVTYTVASSSASNLSIVSAGTNYVVGDVLTVVGDTSVTVTVNSVA